MSDNKNSDSIKKQPSIEDLKNLKCVEGYNNRIKHHLRFCDQLIEEDRSAETKRHIFNTVEKAKSLMREAEIKYPADHISFPISEQVHIVYKEEKVKKEEKKQK